MLVYQRVIVYNPRIELTTGLKHMTNQAENYVVDFSDLDEDLSQTFTPRTPDEFDAHDQMLMEQYGNSKSQSEFQYVEPCTDCRGTGKFYSYTGRLVGDCYKCKGEGKRYFKTSPEAREQARNRGEVRKARKEQELAQNTAQWKLDNAEMFAFLSNNTWSSFYNSMLESIETYGALTNGQAIAVQNSMDKAAAKQTEYNARPADVQFDETGLAALHGLFQNAANSGLKHPKLRISDVIISVAPAHGKNGGSLYVKSDASEYLGKITPEGKFLKVNACTSEYITTLENIAKDPLQAAQMHGHQTGNCSCCGRELTNPESVELGIGPICRERWGF